MAILSDYEEEEQKQSLKKTFNSVLDSSDPLQFLKTAFEFVASETDLFKKESVIKDVNGLVRSVKEKIDSDEKKRKEEDVNGVKTDSKRVKEDSSPAGPSQSAVKKVDDNKGSESKELKDDEKKGLRGIIV